MDERIEQFLRRLSLSRRNNQPCRLAFFRFALSFCDIEELLTARGILVTYEAVRQWCLGLGHKFAKKIRRRQPSPSKIWFLDIAFVTVGGQRHYLWRAADQIGKDRQGDVIVEMVIWALPEKTTDRPHGIKYRLYCGVNDVCVVRYDKETGKGDNRHNGDSEEPYGFESVDTLIADFRHDCSRLTDWRWE